ncbi:hypothetical protein CkaCkLH20_02977 [Colletotrichum karsti]|uniref:H-type lectin domain-containing protein n=1 Tax=Colletotrichum karsti TaxID=1095194 RepID=A0A9P6LKI3_9PEZI|nr:uncharacterized protein CkaCkLH20_02977 [Colletotrichum karsti]KAF9879434.1 hypothetical protein CkaCkLH20_02977 [Colletotrichum karsti]
MATTLMTAGSSSALTNKAPLLFCAPGPRNGSFCGYKNWQYDQIETFDNFAWPGDKEILVKFLPGHKTFKKIEKIIIDASQQWLKTIDTELKVTWVESGEADIRVSVDNNEPDWSALGSYAARYSQDEPTMNICLGGWKENKTVFTHKNVERVALHLFGHALGLPHAKANWSSLWNNAELEKYCGTAIAAMVKEDQGNLSMTSSHSVMGFDRPASLSTSGVDEFRGGNKLDRDSIALLKRLYGGLDCHSARITAKEVSGWSGGWNIEDKPAKQWCQVSQTTKCVAGLSMLNLGINGNFRIATELDNIQSGRGYDVVIKTWKDTDLIDASSNVLSFNANDCRVQTGYESYADIRSDPNDRSPGVPVSKWVKFARPMRNPRVVAFISRFDTMKGRYIRIGVYADEVTDEGFKIHLNTWHGRFSPFSFLLHVTDSHEADDSSIRSGVYEFPFHHNWTDRDEGWFDFSKVMCRKPQNMFLAFSHIDVHPDRNIRLSMEADDWNEYGVRGRIKTWERESKYCQMKGVYIAVL